MKRGWIGLFLLFCIVCSCKKQETPPAATEGEYRIFYLDQKEQVLVGEGYTPKYEEGEALLKELLQRMKRTEREELTSAFGEEVRLPELSMLSDGLVTLLFDESYATVSGVREVLMRAAIVKTLCQCAAVEEVEFYVAGQPLMSSQNTPIGIMKAENFIDSTGPDTDSRQNLQAILYYTDYSGTVLYASSMTLSFNSTESDELAVLHQLIQGPEERGMYPVLPDTLTVHSAETKDGICTVDFGAEFLENRKKVSEEVLIYSVVNSLVNLPGVQKVQFLIDGQTYKLFQKMDLSLTYERNLNIVENE